MSCASWALPKLDEELCTLCGLCVAVCPHHGIHLGESGPVFDMREACDACGQCEDVCPEGAIEMAFEIVLQEGTARSVGDGGQDA